MIDSNLSYKITDKTLLHIAHLERNITILTQNELPAATRYKKVTESLFEDLFAISSLFKLNLTHGDIKKIAIGRETSSKEEKLLSNIRQIFDFIQNNYRKDNIVFNFHLVQHIVKLLQSEILEVWDIGKIRTGGETVDKTFELENQSYTNSDISGLLADAVLWIENDNDTHPFIKACVFMMLINVNSPFVGLNFISSLIFFRVILEKYNYGNGFCIPLFKILNHKNFNMFEMLNASLSKTSTIGLSEVIQSMAGAMDEIINHYKSEFVQFDYVDIKSSTTKLDLNDRQLKLLKLLQQKVFIKRREYIKLFKVSPMTAYRDLNFLQEKNLLVLTGNGKSTTYTLSTKASTPTNVT